MGRQPRSGLKGLLGTGLLAVVTICLGAYGLVEGRNELCVPVTTTLCGFGQAFTLLAAIILFLVLSARQAGGPVATGGLRAWPMQLTTGLLVITALSASSWRRGRLVDKAMRMWNVVLHDGPGSGVSSRSTHRPSAGDGFDDQGYQDGDGDVAGPSDHHAYDPPTGTPPDDRPSTGIRDGFYSSDPFGTRSG